ncbi:prefoldin subunit 5-like [Lineus longissimus]|uniref:prefoldin subunit 5-like n=1 Tax=Lineus longissimus TaxID=88925 RepID=UPI002B4E3B9D
MAKQVDITQLSLQQLNQLSQQLDQEISFYSNSLNTLKMAQQKFSESQECLGKLDAKSKDKEILVPLTSSMYVPGTLSDIDNVLIDVGTGYYVEKEVEGAKAYFKRKVDFLTGEIEKLKEPLQNKYQMKQSVTEVLQMKVQAQMMAQQQTAGKSS